MLLNPKVLQCNMSYSNEKCVYSVPQIDLLGYRISHNSLQPDPDRLSALMNLPVPENPKALQRIIGMFSYYAKWIHKFSDKIKPLNTVTKLPFNQTELESFNLLKKELAEAAMQAIDENIPFTVETDASDFDISAILQQGGRPVAFHSPCLSREGGSSYS